jgi:hypothetical protein
VRSVVILDLGLGLKDQQVIGFTPRRAWNRQRINPSTRKRDYRILRNNSSSRKKHGDKRDQRISQDTQCNLGSKEYFAFQFPGQILTGSSRECPGGD